MRNTLLVLRHELVKTLTRPSFLILSVGIPVLAFGIMSLVSAVNPEPAREVIDVILGEEDFVVEGYVDPSGLIKRLPEDVQPYLQSYPTEDKARQALSEGEISAYYLIPANYLERGEIVQVTPDFNPVGAVTQSEVLERVMIVNLVGDEDLAELVQEPMQITKTALSPQPVSEDDELDYVIPFAIMFLFFSVIVGSASLLLSSVAREKENRMMETLLTSVTSLELLRGKIIGLGISGLIQTLIWSGTGQLLLTISGRRMNAVGNWQLPPSFFLWGIVFFVLGYVVNASLMAGLGALVPDLRESTYVVSIITAPMYITMLLMTAMIRELHHPLPVALSLFPITSPVAMMTRLAADHVPLWQPILACGLLIAMVPLIVRGASRAFNAQTLLSGQPFRLKMYFQVLLGKE